MTGQRRLYAFSTGQVDVWKASDVHFANFFVQNWGLRSWVKVHTQQSTRCPGGTSNRSTQRSRFFHVYVSSSSNAEMMMMMMMMMKPICSEWFWGYDGCFKRKVAHLQGVEAEELSSDKSRQFLLSQLLAHILVNLRSSALQTTRHGSFKSSFVMVKSLLFPTRSMRWRRWSYLPCQTRRLLGRNRVTVCDIEGCLLLWPYLTSLSKYCSKTKVGSSNMVKRC